jgi:HicB_like antitoxin of bacterial toxin-antitoxin system
MAGEALALKIKVLTETGKTIPEPSSLESVMADSGNRASAVILVPVTSPAPKNVSVNITLPDDILAAIDRFAANSGLSRSGFIENAAKEAMKFEHRL